MNNLDKYGTISGMKDTEKGLKKEKTYLSTSFVHNNMDEFIFNTSC